MITVWVTKDGEVESVSVDGVKDYSSSEWYPKDVVVVISYHTSPSKEEDKEDDDKSVGSTDEELSTEEEEDSIVELVVEDTQEATEVVVHESGNENKAMKLFDGTIYASSLHVVTGTIVVRTSNNLKASQQKSLKKQILDALE